MRVLMRSLALTALLALVAVVPSFAQAPTVVSATTPAPNIVLIPISATSATVNAVATLTIPAPAGGLSNYVCSLAYQVGNDGTGTAISNAVSTTTNENFNTFAVKFSQPATASVDSGVLTVFQAQAASGCPKSTVPGTATIFASPAGLTHAMWTWYAVYFQAP